MDDEVSCFRMSVSEEMDPYFQAESLSTDGIPKCVILVGGPAAGKTTLRKTHYGAGYVVVDAVPIFLHLCRGEDLPFPGWLSEPMEIIGRLVAEKAVRERRNIVTELIGDDSEALNVLVDALIGAGYHVDLVLVTCPMEQAVRRNLERDNDCISAFYAAQYQYRWLLAAAQAYPETPSAPTGVLSPEE